MCVWVEVLLQSDFIQQVFEADFAEANMSISSVSVTQRFSMFVYVPLFQV